MLLTASAASAQTTYRLGVRVGGNLATTSFKNYSEIIPDVKNSQTFSSIFAGQVGVVFEAERGRFAFQPALLFSQKGTLRKQLSTYTVAGTSYEIRREGETTMRYNWIEMPLNFTYTLPGTTGLQVFAGPYAAVGVGGRAVSEVTNSTNDPNQSVAVPTQRYTNKIEYGSSNASPRFDAGVNFGLGYRKGPVQLQAGYGLGVINLYNNRVQSGVENGANRVFQLTGTYFLPLN
ncbi:hypothetical protein GCM10023186_16740 [Hymenobacter koreensis]|uniref:PorT family protein n=1 Tax=Hymenobacter koreensis TaxID=1084523 RepID=A0ABP8IXY4_9BACT